MSKRSHHRQASHKVELDSAEATPANGREAIAVAITFAIIGLIVVALEWLLHSESNTIYHVTAGVLSAPIHLITRRLFC